ncbi:hypothetical protein F2Q69_00052873 [Brassica cretica]|uniref:Uncharacterized protein n=1 Tax=Brassica cretica TaxID=69181 RepID=A0A8S9N5M6_BRACR|nr:hypothetical protein F2Q69_00052873 [Brassica cretica]
MLRTARMGGYGLLVLGPTLHYWFNFMSRLFPKQDLITTFKKMAMGQTIYGPIMTVVFFSLNATLQGESGSDIVARLKRDVIPAMFNGVMYWPICDFITFRFFPVHLQPLVSNSFSYLWTIYMTYKPAVISAETPLYLLSYLAHCHSMFEGLAHYAVCGLNHFCFHDQFDAMMRIEEDEAEKGRLRKE